MIIILDRFYNLVSIEVNKYHRLKTTFNSLRGVLCTFSYSFSQSFWCISHITIYICTTDSSTSTTSSHLCTS